MAISPLLHAALEAVTHADVERRMALASQMSATASADQLPVSVRTRRLQPEERETWKSYRARAEEALAPLREEIQAIMGLEARPLLAANAITADADPDQIHRLDEQKGVEYIELDSITQVVQMDDAVVDIGLADFRATHPAVDGAGVRVAVLDSGIDAAHPALVVADSVSTCGEAVSIPGSHGTHCAGSVASRDAIYPGVAPGVRLLDIKVLNHLGAGTHGDIVSGIDAALDREANILSMSLGFNHLPSWSQGGHGWSCPTGDCVLCRAVDSAVALGALVVAAAGNEHEKAEALRSYGHGALIDTELGCPGHARDVITVGALTKRTFLTAPFSSRGPTAYGSDKPDLAAPGVNVWSTIPVPRDPSTHEALPGSPRGELFARKSGTSMATPIVAGAAALIVALLKQARHAWKPADVRAELFARGVTALQGRPVREVGAARLDLSRL